MVMNVSGILLMVITAAPYELTFEVTNCLAPLVRVTTVITEPTAIITPSSVRIERSLLDHRDCSASLNASISCMISLSQKLARPVRRRYAPTSPMRQRLLPVYANSTFQTLRNEATGPGICAFRLENRANPGCHPVSPA